MTIPNRLKEWVLRARAWLVEDVTIAICGLNTWSFALEQSASTNRKHLGELLRENREEIARLGKAVQELSHRADMLRSELDATQAMLQRMGGLLALPQTVDRILLLLEPQAQKLHTKRPTVQDWDEYNATTFAQFEETKR